MSDVHPLVGNISVASSKKSYIPNLEQPTNCKPVRNSPRSESPQLADIEEPDFTPEFYRSVESRPTDWFISTSPI